MNIDELKYLNIANKIQQRFHPDPIISQLEQLANNSSIFIAKKKIVPILPKNFKVAIIDFESSPVILVGILIYDTIITLYVKKLEYIEEFFQSILQAMKILKDLSLFAFSNYESKELLKMYTYLEIQGHNLSDYEFLKSLTIVDLQEHRFESLAEALYTIDAIHDEIQTTGDILLRKSHLVPSLFKLEKIKMIIEHNRNCLSNESIILLKRWVRNYQIKTKKTKEVKFLD